VPQNAVAKLVGHHRCRWISSTISARRALRLAGKALDHATDLEDHAARIRPPGRLQLKSDISPSSCPTCPPSQADSQICGIGEARCALSQNNRGLRYAHALVMLVDA
jgi:hypothetical protein